MALQVTGGISHGPYQRQHGREQGQRAEASRGFGQGLILAPDFLVADEIKSGRIIAVMTEFPCPELPINTVYSAGIARLCRQERERPGPSVA